MNISNDTMTTARGVFAGAYMSGLCVALAIAVHRRAGWPLIAVRTTGGELLHAACLTPQGSYADARGENVREEFLRGGFFGTLAETTEAELLSEDPEITEKDIEEADRVIPLLLPTVPGESRWSVRVDDFARKLEALCRETGIWIRSDSPHGIAAYDAYGDEGPFKVVIGPMAEASLHRTLG